MLYKPPIKEKNRQAVSSRKNSNHRTGCKEPRREPVDNNIYKEILKVKKRETNRLYFDKFIGIMLKGIQKL